MALSFPLRSPETSCFHKQPTDPGYGGAGLRSQGLAEGLAHRQLLFIAPLPITRTRESEHIARQGPL